MKNKNNIDWKQVGTHWWYREGVGGEERRRRRAGGGGGGWNAAGRQWQMRAGADRALSNGSLSASGPQGHFSSRTPFLICLHFSPFQISWPNFLSLPSSLLSSLLSHRLTVLTEQPECAVAVPFLSCPLMQYTHSEKRRPWRRSRTPIKTKKYHWQYKSSCQ